MLLPASHYATKSYIMYKMVKLLICLNWERQTFDGKKNNSGNRQFTGARTCDNWQPFLHPSSDPSRLQALSKVLKKSYVFSLCMVLISHTWSRGMHSYVRSFYRYRLKWMIYTGCALWYKGRKRSILILKGALNQQIRAQWQDFIPWHFLWTFSQMTNIISC